MRIVRIVQSFALGALTASFATQDVVSAVRGLAIFALVGTMVVSAFLGEEERP